MSDTIQIPLTRGKSATVDVEDAWLLEWEWCVSKQGSNWYAHRRDAIGGIVSMHRAILRPPDNVEVDHRNLNGLDNRRQNLRVATRSQNMANGRLRSNNSSGYKGVSWSKVVQKWHAYIMRDYKRIHLGYYSDIFAAALAYDLAAVKIFGPFAKLNLSNYEKETYTKTQNETAA